MPHHGHHGRHHHKHGGIGKGIGKALGGIGLMGAAHHGGRHHGGHHGGGHGHHGMSTGEEIAIGVAAGAALGAGATYAATRGTSSTSSSSHSACGAHGTTSTVYTYPGSASTATVGRPMTAEEIAYQQRQREMAARQAEDARRVAASEASLAASRRALEEERVRFEREKQQAEMARQRAALEKERRDLEELQMKMATAASLKDEQDRKRSSVSPPVTTATFASSPAYYGERDGAAAASPAKPAATATTLTTTAAMSASNPYYHGAAAVPVHDVARSSVTAASNPYYTGAVPGVAPGVVPVAAAAAYPAAAYPAPAPYVAPVTAAPGVAAYPAPAGYPTLAKPVATASAMAAPVTTRMSATSAVAVGGATFSKTGQPKADHRPGVTGVEPYSRERAMEDARALRAAMKGFGCDKKVIVDITGTRNHFQRLMIKEAYKNVDGDGKERNILKDLGSELSGNFRKLVLFLYANPGAPDAKWFKEAMDGRGYNTQLLCEVLCTRTNEQLKAAVGAWSIIAGAREKSLSKRINEETAKMFSSGHFQTFCMNIINLKRPSSAAPGPDVKTALADAELLNRKLSAKSSEAKRVFVDVFSTRSWVQLASISEHFQSISKKWTLDAAIHNTFGDCDTAVGMRTVLKFATAPYDFWAEKLQKSMKGLGTDDCLLRRIIVSRSEIDLANISEVFAARYGKGKTLISWIESDCSGEYKKLLLLLCGKR